MIFWTGFCWCLRSWAAPHGLWMKSMPQYHQLLGRGEASRQPVGTAQRGEHPPADVVLMLPAEVPLACANPRSSSAERGCRQRSSSMCSGALLSICLAPSRFLLAWPDPGPPALLPAQGHPGTAATSWVRGSRACSSLRRHRASQEDKHHLPLLHKGSNSKSPGTT